MSPKTAPCSSKKPHSKRALTDHSNIAERLGLRLYVSTDMVRPTNYNVLVSGLITALKGFHEHASAETLFYVEYPEKEMAKRKKLCQAIINVLKDIKCPFQLEPHHFLYLDYEALTPMYLWVLRQGLLLQCEDLQCKKPYTNFFYRKFASGQEAHDEFEKVYNLRIDGFNGEYNIFKRKIYGKKLSGTAILGEYLLNNYFVSTDTDTSECEGFESNREVTVEALLRQDTRKPLLKKYRDVLGKWIEQLTIDDHIDLLEKRMMNEARAYFMTRMEFQFVESHMFCFEGREVESYDTTIIPKLYRHMDDLMCRLRVFKNSAHNDCNTTEEMKLKVQPTTELKNEKAAIRKELLEKYIKYSDKLKRIAGKTHELILRLARTTANTLGTKEREAQVDAMMYNHALESEEFFMPIDDKIVEGIIELSHKITCITSEVKVHMPSEYKRAQQYQQFFFQYIGDLRFRLADMFWKAEMLHHNRVEEKKRVDDIREKMREIHRAEVKAALQIDIVLEVNQTVSDIEVALDELIIESQGVRSQMLQICADLV